MSTHKKQRNINLICPDCGNTLEENNCAACNWKFELFENIPIFLSTNDKKNSIFKDYQKNYDQIARDDLKVSIQPEHYLNHQIDKLYSYLPNLKNKKILEVGIGQGKLFNKMKENEFKSLVGLDIAVDYLKRIKKAEKIDLIIGNAENLPFKDEFDLIIATDILEHVLNVGDFIISLNQSLKKGGITLIKVPYKEDLRQYAQKNNCPYKFVHLRTFTKDLLKFTLKESGFKIKKIHFDGWAYYKSRKKLFKYIAAGITLLRFGKFEEISRIPNWIGRFLMRPNEITILAQKLK
jgi:2-polyprenyl-3-methyl-5-hydroxy-6-metoxy-1,4-benzoquinol methylase